MRRGRGYSAPSCHLGTEHPRDLFRIARLRGPAVPAAAPPEGESSAAGALSSGPPPGGAGDFKSARGNSTNFGLVATEGKPPNSRAWSADLGFKPI